MLATGESLEDREVRCAWLVKTREQRVDCEEAAVRRNHQFGPTRARRHYAIRRRHAFERAHSRRTDGDDSPATESRVVHRARRRVIDAKILGVRRLILLEARYAS